MEHITNCCCGSLLHPSLQTKNLAVPGPEEIAIVVTPPMKVEGDQDLEGGDEIDVDPNDLCIICFERSKNAVGHFGCASPLFGSRSSALLY